MKASNPIVMIEAYQLLAQELDLLDWDYPLHLGVTEAGCGDEGRIKSSVGTGSLLLQGLGDTIRISLTEDPEREIPVANALCDFVSSYLKENDPLPTRLLVRTCKVSPPFHPGGSVFAQSSKEDVASEDFFEQIGFLTQFGRPIKTDQSVDGIIYDGVDLPPKLTMLKEMGVGIFFKKDIPHIRKKKELEEILEQKKQAPCFLFAPETNPIKEIWDWFAFLEDHKIATPVLLSIKPTAHFLVEISAAYGSLLAQTLGEGVALIPTSHCSNLAQFGFALLQSCGRRATKTEFISCPGCGRTLFDLQTVTEQIRSKTGHLPGIKIAVMGCIVNGPGEMADSHFGYVGSKVGKIDLYVGKERVEKDIDSEEAVERLILLIKSHGLWLEPPKSKEQKGALVYTKET